MTEESCKTCKYYDEGDRCLRFPPTAIFVSGSTLGGSWQFPEVTQFDWCGEWKAKEEERP